MALDNALDWNEEGVLPDDFRFVFTETDKSFFKNKEVNALDEKIGDLDAVSTYSYAAVSRAEMRQVHRRRKVLMFSLVSLL